MAPPKTESKRQRTSSAGSAAWTTNLTSISPNKILVRGYRLDDLMGRVSFGDATYLLLTGELPSSSVSRLMDAMLVSFIDHGATPPSTLAALNTVTTGAGIRGAVAAGVLGFGRYHGGTALACRALLDEGLDLTRGGQTMAQAANQLVKRLVDTDDLPPPGFGHRYHTVDPRATRLLQLAHELEEDHNYTQMLRALEVALSRHDALQGQSLGVNIDGAISAVCGNLGLPPDVADALLTISRVPGLTAHVLEEQRRESPMRAIDPSKHSYDGPPERRLPEGRK
jgi:citrate synthase